MSHRLPIRRALLSVYDKTGLVDLGRALADAGVALVSTGGSYRTLTESGIPVTEVTKKGRGSEFLIRSTKEVEAK